LALIVLTFGAHVLVLANPGYFNHDEWQRADDVEAYGLVNYFDLYTKSQAGIRTSAIPCVQSDSCNKESAIWMQSNPKFLASFSSMAEEAIAGGSNRLHIRGAHGARKYVAERALFGRDAFSGRGKWPTVVGAAPSLEHDSNFVMQPNCTMLRQ
jgi:hypothetical protein